VTTRTGVQAILLDVQGVEGKKGSTSSSQYVCKEQKNIKKILNHCLVYGGVGEAVNYSQIFAFCGGSWNLTLQNVRDD
jgi:hypothetical protein